MDQENSSQADINEAKACKMDLSQLSHDKLVLKCKHYISIAQKAKIAKDEAKLKYEELERDNDALRDKTAALEKQFHTCQELLGALTEQKLNLSIELDDLKKLKVSHLEKISYLSNNCEKAETEAESFKRLYHKLVRENEELISKVEEMEKRNEFDTEKRNKLQSDLQKLQENNENIKELWTGVNNEKNELENQLLNANSRITKYKKEHDSFLDFVSSKFHGVNGDVTSWINHFDSLLAKVTKFEEHSKEVSILKHEIEELHEDNSRLRNDLLKATSESPKDEMMARNEVLLNELKAANRDKDKMIKNLEEVRIETRELIKHTESLSKEVERLKIDKCSLEFQLNQVFNENIGMKKDFDSRLMENDRLLEKIKVFEEEKKKLLLSLDESGKLGKDSEIAIHEAQMLSKKVHEMHDVINAMESEKEKLDQKLRSLLKDKDGTGAEILHVKSELEETRQNLNASISKREELQRVFEKMKKEFENQIKLMAAEMNALLSEKEELLTELTAIQRGPSEELLILKESNMRLGEEISRLKLEGETMLAALEESKRAIEELHKLRTAKIELEKNISVIQKASKELQKAISDKDSKLETLQEKLSDFETVEQESLRLPIIEDKLSELQMKLEKAEEEMSDVRVDNTTKGELINRLTEERENLVSFLEEKEENLKELVSLRDRQFEENEVLKEALQAHQKEIELLGNVQEKEKLEKLVKALTEEVERCKEIIKYKDIELKESNRVWVGRLTALKGALLGLKRTHEDINKYFKEVEKYCTTLYPKIANNIEVSVQKYVDQSLTTNQQELLKEMQSMNQVLKERGELISKLQESLCEHQSRLLQANDERARLTTDLDELRKNLTESEKVIELKENQVRDLEIEINRLRDSQEMNSEVEAMSSSTLSRLEEATRLKDIEESFEEKYTKLKLMAIRLKKKLNDVTRALDQERIKSSGEKIELMEKIQSLSSAAKTATKVQELYDKALDEIEEKGKENKRIKETLDMYNKLEEEYKQKIATLEIDSGRIPVLRKQIDGLEASLKEYRKEVANLTIEKKEEVAKNEALRDDVSKLEATLTQKEQALEACKHQEKNYNVLELEIKNYEKVEKELSSQLNEEHEKAHTQNREIDSLKNIERGLREQISLLEGRLSAEEERNSCINVQLTSNRSQINDLQARLSECLRQTDKITKDFQLEKATNEELMLQISKISNQFTESQGGLLKEVDTLRSNVQNLEVSLHSARDQLEVAQNESTRVLDEFQAYKIRAQSVLAKQKTEGSSQLEKIFKETVDSLHLQMEDLRTRLDEALFQIEEMKGEKDLTMVEKERMEKKVEDLSTALQCKTEELDKLEAEYRTYKLTSETLIQSLKKEMEEKDRRYEDDRRSLNSTISEMKTVMEMYGGISTQEGEKISIEVATTESVPNVTNGDGTMHMTSEREDAEGSESVPSPKRRRSFLVPLDVLLNSSVDDESKIAALSDQLEKLKNELSSYEIRTRHLSSLLSEAEKDSARTSQLNSVLKEEVRRLERSLERQPHATNTEYLKNVIIKFLTLQSGDERTRLVPVLDTILKLSPQETQKISAIAKGEAQSGWGNYLPSWTGL